MGEFQNLIFDANWREIGTPRAETGLVIAFDRPVRTETIFRRLDDERTRSEVFQLYVRHTDQRTGLLCECILPRAIYQAVEVTGQDGDGRIVEVAPLPPDGRRRGPSVSSSTPSSSRPSSITASCSSVSCCAPILCSTRRIWP